MVYLQNDIYESDAKVVHSSIFGGDAKTIWHQLKHMSKGKARGNLRLMVNDSNKQKYTRADGRNLDS